MKTIKTSKLISQESIAHSITVSPAEGKHGFEIAYSLRTKTKDGRGRKKTVYVESIIEDTEIPHISNWTVKHLGYKTYQFYQKQKDGFYINFYKN